MKFKNIMGSSLTALVLLSGVSILNHDEVHAQMTSDILKQDSYMFNSGFTSAAGANEAKSKAAAIPNSELTVKRVNNPKGSYSGVGRIYNKGVTKGTAFVVGDHTIITNNHIVRKTTVSPDRKQYANDLDKLYNPISADKLEFAPAYNAGSAMLGTYEIKDVQMIRGLDIAVLHTKKKIDPRVTRYKLASESSINHLKQNDAIYGVGYPSKDLLPITYHYNLERNWRMYKFTGYYLQKAKTQDPQFYTKMIIRKGSSGSPIFNSNNEVIGVNSNGFNITNKATWQAAPYEMAFVQSLTGKQRQTINQLIR